MPVITKKNVFHALNEFYGEILEPRFDGIDKRLDEHDQGFKNLLEHLPFPPFEAGRKNGFFAKDIKKREYNDSTTFKKYLRGFVEQDFFHS